jgi:hypothetical protein
VAEILSRRAEELVDGFNRRVTNLRERPEYVALTRGLRVEEAVVLANRLLKPGEWWAVGIDGSLDYDERLEMLLFYVCATGYRCPLIITRDRVEFDLKRAERDARLSASTAVPLWADDLSDVSPSGMATDQVYEQAIQRIPFAMMTMAELVLALQAVRTPQVKVVFLDRPLTGTYGPLLTSTRRLLKLGRSRLVGLPTREGELTLMDLDLASVLGPGDLYVPPRHPYLRRAALQVLIRESPISRAELGRRLYLDEKDLSWLMANISKFDKEYDHQFLERSDLQELVVRERVRGFWRRAVEVAERLAERFFYGEGHPLIIEGKGWLSVRDMNTVNLILLYRLIEESIKRGVLLIGVTKDTGATDFTRSVIPFSAVQGVIAIPEDGKEPAETRLKNDQAFLTVMSTVNHERIKPPWRTLSYDVCFTSLVWAEGDKDKGGEGLRAARKTVFREQLFVKSYFQLAAFRLDESARSPVFVYDRLFDPSFDLDFVFETGARDERGDLVLRPYFEGKGFNPLDNLVLHLLAGCDNPEVIEAFGHNQLLYLADKAVKFEVKHMRETLRGVADIKLGTLTRRGRLYSIYRRFRTLRGEYERARSRGARGW